jgi:hypothetical protein
MLFEEPLDAALQAFAGVDFLEKLFLFFKFLGGRGAGDFTHAFVRRLGGCASLLFCGRRVLRNFRVGCGF